MAGAGAKAQFGFSSRNSRRAHATGALDAEKLRRIGRLVRLARVMDSAVRIPGIGLRLGADSLLGLLPVVGDATGALIGGFIINEARRLGMPQNKLLQMAGNIGVDAVLGSVPLLGDVFDVYFKSHRRNVQMILDHFGVSREQALRASR
ncbi:DUF4112 domain-containing protein [Rhizobium lemnae]|uniref:DUF4112 domain-containing protein n=1 Tax=Rhizobium lemnae TaxID=1214924 RepID=A0ABV8EEG6_9HYPH|nr:DUF4112 domain-containing protein [Rhizobium lemnae]MCJ8508877.1 DUF4112 domain-containing protein [Rhizobium lemnae]